MASLVKRWIEEQQERALSDPEFPCYMTKEEMLRNLDKEYEDWEQKRKFIEDNYFSLQINCDITKSGKSCGDPNCLQCKEYYQQTELITTKTDNQ